MTRFLQCGSVVFRVAAPISAGKSGGERRRCPRRKGPSRPALGLPERAGGGQETCGINVPEILVNQYIAYLIDSKTRLGVKAATIKITGKDTVTVGCRLNLVQIGKWNAAAIKADPLLAGKDDLNVTAAAKMDITNGIATVSLLSAHDATGGIGLDTLKALFRVVARNQPEHFDIDHPIKLPFDLSVVMADGVFYGKTPRTAPK